MSNICIKAFKILDKFKTTIYPYFNKRNCQSVSVLLCTLLKNSNYFYFGFDREKGNHKQEL